jgi:hypothetical protein
MWSIWLCVLPSGDVQVTLWMLRCGNIVLLTVRFLDVAKLTTLTPLSLLISCKLRKEYTFNYIGFEVFTAVAMNSFIFWDIMPCSLVKVNRGF